MASRDLWMLVQGTLTRLASLRSFFRAMVLMVLYLYMSAIFLKTMVGDNEEIRMTETSLSTEGFVAESFGSVTNSMWTLFAALTGGVDWLIRWNKFGAEVGQN